MKKHTFEIIVDGIPLTFPMLRLLSSWAVMAFFGFYTYFIWG